MTNSSKRGIWIAVGIIIVAVAILMLVEKDSASTDNDTVTGLPIISVGMPIKDASWKIGSRQEINWKFSGNIPEGYKVALVFEPGFIPIGIVSATSTSFTYTVPPMICIGGDACMDATTDSEPRKIKAMLYDHIDCLGFCVSQPGTLISEDTSDGFITISKKDLSQADLPTTPSIVISLPLEGASWKIGSNQSVKWTSTGNFPSSYKLGIYIGKSLVKELNQPFPGQYLLQVPRSVFVGDVGRELTPGKYDFAVKIYDGPINIGGGNPSAQWGTLILEDSREITITN